jgi:hypothetical protein
MAKPFGYFGPHFDLQSIHLGLTGTVPVSQKLRLRTEVNQYVGGATPYYRGTQMKESLLFDFGSKKF